MVRPSDVQNSTMGDLMKTTLRSAILVTVAVAVGTMVSTRTYADSRDPANYIGPKMCGICHKKDETGNQFAKWQAGPHAKAFETLGTPAALEIAKKLGIDDPQKSGKCLK